MYRSRGNMQKERKWKDCVDHNMGQQVEDIALVYISDV